MITDILYRCPHCGLTHWLAENACIHCGTPVRVVSRSEVVVGNERKHISVWYEIILGLDLPTGPEGVVSEAKNVNLSRETANGIYEGFSGIRCTRFTRSVSDTGSLTLTMAALSFNGIQESFQLPIQDLLSVTIESNTIILNAREHGMLFFDFMEESGKKWEDLIRKTLSLHHAPRKILAFYPRISFMENFRKHPGRVRGHEALKVPVKKSSIHESTLILDLVRFVAKPVIRSMFSVDIKGLDHIPAQGAAVLMSNHASFLDSIILAAFPKRHIWFMAKNSEYRNPLLTWALRQAGSFPVRRYAIDAQAVRNAVRVIQQGHILGIYPEGERSWDNRLLPLRNGTMRLILALGKPVIPVGISGSYELMPRWTSKIEKSPIRIRIGEPFLPPHIPIPSQTLSHIQDLEQVIRSHILRLSGEHR